MDGGGASSGPIPGPSSLTSTSVPVFPRLRLNRRTNSNNSESSPVPGPSSQPSDDTQLTPRVAAPPTFPPAPTFSMATPLDTPAARLRALLSKSPNDWSISRQRDPSFLEPDSDFDPPHGDSASVSHHQSLRQLFTRALRDDTPQKPRVARRNSIDLSEVDSASPRVPRVNDERRRSKQRKSMSDEELEKASRSNQSVRADRYNTLRQRLENSDFDIDIKDIPSFTDQSRSNEFTHDFTHLPRRNDPSISTSSQTNIHSLRFPSRLENDTNLLEQDSEMQNAMKGMDSFESEGTPPPPPRSSAASKAVNDSGDPQSSARKFPATPDTSENLSKTQTTIKKSTVPGLSRHQSPGSLPTSGSPGVSKPSKLPQRTTLSSLHVTSTPSRHSSVISEADHRSVVKEAEKEKLKEREREWNKPPTTPNRSPAHVHERVRKLSTPGSGTAEDSPHSLTARNLELHHRRSTSRNSLIPHSPASSIASFDQERDRGTGHLRERNWNSPHPKWDGARGSPSPTPSNVSERRRTLSHPTRPSLGSRPRYDSMTSSSSSRAASPALSHSSKASVEEEIEYERERNWNSSRPQWSKRSSIESLPPRSPPPPPQQGPLKQTPVRQRAQSLKNTPSPLSDPPNTSRPRLGRSSLSHILPSPAKSPPKSPPKESQLSLSQPDIVISPSTPPRPSTSPKSKPPISPPKRLDFGPGRKFPVTAVSDTESEPEPQDKDGLTRPPVSLERPPPTSRIPIRASTSAVKLDDIPKHKEAGTIRHRRSFTEFHQANGAIPPRVSVQTLLPPHSLAPEDALHKSDEESSVDSPMSSTPRPGPLPLEPSPLVSGLKELSPLHEVSLPLANGGSPPNGSPKKSSPLADSPPIIISEPALSLVTPPRDTSNTLKMTLKTPSPPTDIPDLPDIPSSDGSGQSTPVMSSNLTMMNTPKPPGAWMQTPAPALRSGRARSNTLPSNTSDVVYTPLPIQRGNTFPIQTPAPPGAWNGTPGFGSVGRKSALKVRFDVTSESETPSSPGQQDISLESIEMVHPSDDDHTHPTTSASNKANGVGYDEPRSAFSSFSSSDTSEMEDGPRTPVLKPTSMPTRTPPSVRMVDAFGREVVEESSGREANDVSPMTLPSQDASPTRKPSVRIVDAMGREVQQNGDAIKPDTVEEEPSEGQSLTKMRESISTLAKEMDDIDLSSSSDDESDEARLKELNETSANAREAREKLKQTIHAVQSGEEDWKAKYGTLRASMRKSISLPSGTPDRPFPRSRTSGMVIGFIALAQIAFILYMLRLSHVRSRQLFLSTYYEPLFPDLDLHVTHPERFIQSLENVSPPWSIYHVPGTWARAGWRAVISEFAGNMTLQVSDWQRQMQEHWRDTYSRTDMPWPPT